MTSLEATNSRPRFLIPPMTSERWAQVAAALESLFPDLRGQLVGDADRILGDLWAELTIGDEG